MRRAWQFRKEISTISVLILATTLCTVSYPYFISEISNKLIAGETFVDIMPVFSMIAGILLLSQLFSWMKGQYEIRKLHRGIIDTLNKESMNHLRKFSVGQHLNNHSAVIQKQISDGESSVRDLMRLFVYDVIPQFGMVILAIGAILWTYPSIGMLCIGFAGIIIYPGIKISLAFKDRIDEISLFESEVLSKSRSNLHRYLPHMIVNVVDKRFSERHQSDREVRSDICNKTWGSYLNRVMMISVPGNLFRLIIVGSAAYMISIGQMEFGALMSVVMWSNQAFNNLGRFPNWTRNVLDLLSKISLYFDVFDIEPEIVRPENATKISVINGDIEFRNVWFSYPDSKETLKDVSFNIKQGETVGIVGSTGAGKSTILSLLMGAYDPDLGSILIDGRDLSSLNEQSFRERVGFIHQKPDMIDGTILDNLMFGVTDSRAEILTEKDCLEALRKVGLGGEEYPLDRNIGESGAKLSGGENQRVAIARVILRDPDILVVDEATSAVDTVTEADIHKQIRKISKGCTKIIIAHRLSAVVDADKIIVLDKGKIVGIGTHQELLESCSQYEKMAKIFFAGA